MTITFEIMAVFECWRLQNDAFTVKTQFKWNILAMAKKSELLKIYTSNFVRILSSGREWHSFRKFFNVYIVFILFLLFSIVYKQEQQSANNIQTNLKLANTIKPKADML